MSLIRVQKSAPSALVAAPEVRESATREQLLDAGSEVFAECGFRRATVRDICRRAGANVAAVNYHFGGKDELYLAVLRRNFQSALRRFPPDGGVPAGASAEERLAGFVRSFVDRIFVTGPDSCHGRILAREMVDPTPALDAVVETEMRGVARGLESLVREVMGPGAEGRDVWLAMASVVSQVVFYQHCRPVISRLLPGLRFAEGDLAMLAAHITRFSLAGLRGSGPSAAKGRAARARSVRVGGRS
ncbi:MAG: CerR family C-terminal domain-containing protein [Verrucomicrobiales bacterium]|nr:CerR family C-terminal domain-containing protein [Verrucomicrobiales bacterium]